MYQLAQLAVYGCVLAAFVVWQLTAVERGLRGLGRRQWPARVGLSLLYTVLGYGVCVALLLTANVVMTGNYQRGWFDPYAWVPLAAGTALAASLPWWGLLLRAR